MWIEHVSGKLNWQYHLWSVLMFQAWLGKKLLAKKMLFVVNTPEFFLSHRLPIALAARKVGYEVHVATADGVAVQSIKSFGFIHHKVAIARSGQNPFTERAIKTNLDPRS